MSPSCTGEQSPDDNTRDDPIVDSHIPVSKATRAAIRVRKSVEGVSYDQWLRSQLGIDIDRPISEVLNEGDE